MKLDGLTRETVERVTAPIVDGPARKTPYSRRDTADLATKVSAHRTNGGPWKITVAWRRLKKDGTQAQTGHSTQTLGSWYGRTDEGDALGAELAILLGIDWQPQERPTLGEQT
jgi:hypothetical protein